MSCQGSPTQRMTSSKESPKHFFAVTQICLAVILAYGFSPYPQWTQENKLFLSSWQQPFIYLKTHHVVPQLSVLWTGSIKVMCSKTISLLPFFPPSDPNFLSCGAQCWTYASSTGQQCRMASCTHLTGRFYTYRDLHGVQTFSSRRKWISI